MGIVTEEVEFCGCTNEELEAGRTCGQPQCPNIEKRVEGGPFLVKIEILTGPEEVWQTRADYATWLQGIYDSGESPSGNFQIVSVEEPDEAAQKRWWKEVWNK